MFALPLAEDAELRPLEPWQDGEFAVHVDQVRADLAPWIPWAKTVTDAETARAFLQRYADRQTADGGRLYGIWVGGELTGGTLFRLFDTVRGGCEIGVWLGSSAQGRGLITRAARLMMEWAFATRGMARVEWRCDPENARSVAVARRLGMTLEGTRRRAFRLGDEHRDEQIWALLADEWRPSA